MKNVTWLTQFWQHFTAFYWLGMGFQILQVSLAVSWLTGERDCMYQAGETLWGDGATGNILDREGKGEEFASNREELQRLKVATGE